MAQLIPGSTVRLVEAGQKLSGGLVAGEDITAGYVCYLSADGLVYLSGSAIVDDANHPKFNGIAVQTSGSGTPVTLFNIGSRINMGVTDCQIGTRYYSGSTAGLLSDTKLSSADTPIAKAVSSSDILIVRGGY